jgi:hypothetical protein
MVASDAGAARDLGTEANEAGAPEAGAPDVVIDAMNDASDATADELPGDGGTDGAAVVDAASDAACVAKCAREKTGQFCNAGEVQWVCNGPGIGDTRTFQGPCRAAPTDAIRFCCPPSFLAMCQ